MKKLNILLSLILIFCGVNLFAQYDTPLNEIALNDYLPTNASYPFSFVVLADTRDNSSNTSAIDPDFDELMDQIAALDPKFVIDIGDVVNGGTQEQYEAYYNYINPWMQANSIAFFTVPGNHEFNVENSYEQYYPQYIGNKDFSFDLENVRIIAINNAQHEVILDPDQAVDYTIENYQLDFVEEKLNEENSPLLKFGFTHIPILHSTNLQHEGYTAYYNLLKNHYPKANFSGHNHYYQLDNDGCGFLDIITGGGGSNIVGAEMNPPIHQSMHHFLLVTVYEDNHVDVDTYFKDEGHSTVAQAYDFTLSTTGLTGTVMMDANADCLGGNNGSATASGIGGTPPYNYSWDNGEITATAINLNAGEHVCTITDSDGCEISVSVLIENGPSGITDVVHYYTDGNIDSEEYHYANIVVHDGATLTLTPQAIAHFAEHCALIVKPGGLLVVDGALLSNACGDALWLGISVEGNADLSQTSANQGKVIVKNGARIENAHTGVWLRANTGVCTEVLNSGGGIVFARNSTFKNCYVGIEFSPYRDFYANNNPKANKSYVRNCHFLTTRTLNGGFTAKAGISLLENNKLYLKGNLFESTITNPNSELIATGIGIRSVNSTFKATDYCSSTPPPPLGDPCPENDLVKNTFINMVYGVRATAWDMDNTFSINGAEFQKCMYGIYAGNINFASITECNFTVNPDNTFGYWAAPYGVHLLSCGNYEVEENNFNGDNPSIPRVGIVISGSDDVPNQIYKNDFDNLYAASIAQGDNQVNGMEEQGLELLCGQYTNNTYDISLTGYAKIALFQGGSDYSPYNIFNSNICDDANNIHLNDDFEDFFVYFYNGEDEYDFPNLTSCWSQANEQVGMMIPTIIDSDPNYSSVCPTNLSDDEVVLVMKETVENKRVEIVDLKSEISNTENGGENEVYLINYIKNNSNESYEIRNLLYPLSPNLSKNVLIELINRNPAMNEWNLAELLMANSPLNLSVMEVYYEKNPLPSFLHSLLMNYQTGETTLTALNKELKEVSTVKNRAEGDYIRRMMMDLEEATDVEKIEELLAQEEGNQTLKLKISLASAKGDYSAAQSYLDLYQPISDKDAYVEFQEVVLAVKAQPEKFCELSASQKSTLESIIATDKIQKQAAQNILEYSDNQTFEEIVVLPTSGNKSMHVKKEILLQETPILAAYPNPAVDEVYFTISNQNDIEKGFLLIYNNSGKLIDKISLSAYRGIVRLDIQAWASGVYFCKYEINGLLISEKKFTKL